MPTIDPSVRFWVSLVVTVAIGVSSGTLVLTNAVPADWIKPMTAWCGILAFVGSTIMTLLSGAATTTASRIASAAQAPGVKGIVVDPTIQTTAVQAAGANAKVITA